MRQTIMRTTVLFALAAAVWAAPAAASPVRVDRDFGTAGIARSPLPPAYESGIFRKVAATPDGGALTREGWLSSSEVETWSPAGVRLGSRREAEPVYLHRPEAATAEGGRVVGISREYEPKGAVHEYAPDGSPVAGFGTAGVSEPVPFEIDAVAALPTGKVLVAGSGIDEPGGARSEPTHQTFVARLDADGTLDPSFGERGLVAFGGSHALGGAKALTVLGLEGGGVEVADVTAIVALDPSGKKVRSFGEDGAISVLGTAVGAAAGPGGTLLVAGAEPRPDATEADVEGDQEFYVARYTQAGRPDPTYAGGTGVAVLSPDGGAQAASALFEADGSVLVGGLVSPDVLGCPPGYSCRRTPAVVRFTPAGSPDPAFGQGGVALLSALAAPVEPGSFVDGVASLVSRATGGYLASGEAEHGPFLAALTADGTPAAGFGAAGTATKETARGAYSVPIAAAVDAAGDVFVVAATDSGTSLPEAEVVLKYSPGGVLDPTYGEGGEAYIPPGAQGLAVAPDGSAYVTSASESTLTKLTPTGERDPDFGAAGAIRLSAHGRRLVPWDVVALPTGELRVGGELGSHPAVFGFLPDGRPDPSFGRNGRAILDPGRDRTWKVSTIAVDREGRVLLAGSSSRLHSCCTAAGMVLRLDTAGRLDQGFGRGGSVVVGGGVQTSIQSLTMRGDRILAAAVRNEEGPPHDIIFSMDRRGRLDRRFGDRGVARAPGQPQQKGFAGEEGGTVRVFSTPRRILLVRSGRNTPLVAFTPRGRLDRSWLRLKGLTPRLSRRAEGPGPTAVLDGKDLLLAWSAFPLHPSTDGYEGEVNLRRLLLR